MVGSMLILTFIINYFLFDNYFSDVNVFFWSTVVTFIILVPTFLSYGIIAVSLRNRFPEDAQTVRRLSICISVFLLLSSVIVALILMGYETTHFLGYELSEEDYTHCYLAAAIMNVFLTFLNEGVAQFERYKTTLIETEQLKKEYMQIPGNKALQKN